MKTVLFVPKDTISQKDKEKLESVPGIILIEVMPGRGEVRVVPLDNADETPHAESKEN